LSWTPPWPSAEEVCNYLDALAYSREQLADPIGLPLSMRILGYLDRLRVGTELDRAQSFGR
jgi:hypothetical protein